ncbi:polyphosphate kinase 1 [Cyclobacterium marinum]|uniref:Polyphosphate kinase n=1 Tax=Cyclobacterium marinum (strain ATCC 25205 / DSM 745 / LMG 13164 / NCIMB 1802) TaxID=880070 RepID=G0J2A6_CYCMS|nr:polyphosphate kinase 1 [Cyclobacterium marinum]AEL25180.1 polyphosphate kinase 1 [Cyclobacterium marinum DSM 745]
MNYTDRDINWLSFNERILQEAENAQTPLMERLKFLAIYSSNLEEFYRVRVANHRFAQKYKGDKKNKYGYRPSFVLQQINKIVSLQQERLGKVFYSEILPGLSQKGIHLLTQDFSEADRNLMGRFYDEKLKNNFTLKDITEDSNFKLKNQTVYLYAISESRFYLIELDYKTFGRFINLSSSDKAKRFVQLDDIFRSNAPKFLGEKSALFAIKISRDAELYMDEDLEENIVVKIKKSIKNRETGLPSRLLFDENIPFKYIDFLRKKIDVDMSGLIPGGRYHNFYDFFGFPVSEESLCYKKREKVPCARLDQASNWFAEVKKENLFLSFPYQNYRYVTGFLNKAAMDKEVEEINITLYRVAESSEICMALEKAAKSGKRVFVLDEAQARFDEKSNIYWGERLIKAGAHVKYGIDHLKVHAKIFSIKRKEGESIQTYAYMGTGNFNEKTAEIYGDHALITSESAYTKDVDEVFAFLKDKTHTPKFDSLLVAPFNLRSSVEQLIENEIGYSKEGKIGKMTIKLNSLEDPEMINKIRRAADYGVKIELIVRGICCYHPLSALQEKNIKIVSIVDRFLEHTRVYHFHNNNEPLIYLASADWMTRNLSGRIEVAFPIHHKKTKSFILASLNAQLHDNVNGRLITGTGKSQMVSGSGTLSAQEKMYDLVSENNAQYAV